MKKKCLFIPTTIIITMVLGSIVTEKIMSHVETPNYQVLESNGNIELRGYDAMIIAEVDVVGEREDAISNGFRLLANYIFGKNTIQ